MSVNEEFGGKLLNGPTWEPLIGWESPRDADEAREAGIGGRLDGADLHVLIGVPIIGFN